MRPILFRFILVFIVNCVLGQHNQLCENSTTVSRSCTTQILGEDYVDDGSCKVEVIPPDSAHCTDFGDNIFSNAHIGGVSLRPYLLPVEYDNKTYKFSSTNAVLNITFSNIKWKTMKFRFKKNKSSTFCRNIILSNDVTFNDQSVLYYDCYWALADNTNIGLSHILDFEAMNNGVINRGRYYFNMPSLDMLSTTITEVDWKPFVYVEIFMSLLRLHIAPPPSQIEIPEYKIEVYRDSKNGTDKSELVKVTYVKVKNRTSEVVYDYSTLRQYGAYYFTVMPMHDLCKSNKVKCQIVRSPKITSTEVHESFNICIASVTALVVATLFAYYVVLRVVRRYWCKDYALEIPPPTKVLVVYSPANRLHAECVASFVTYLRSEYGFEVMYDGDISSTAHGDPFIWAQEAYNLASHVIYIVGPVENTNLYNNIYDKPILAHKDVDVMLLSLLKGNKVSKCPKDVINVFFEHSNGPIPIETKHDKVFFLLKDWQKLIAYLSRNLLPKKQLMRTEKGKNLLDDLTRAKKMLCGRNDDVIVKCDMNSVEKKVLL